MPPPRVAPLHTTMVGIATLSMRSYTSANRSISSKKLPSSIRAGEGSAPVQKFSEESKERNLISALSGHLPIVIRSGEGKQLRTESRKPSIRMEMHTSEPRHSLPRMSVSLGP